MWKALWNAISGANDTTSLIEEFRYPRLGPGMMWEKTAELIEEKGGSVEMRSEVVKVHHEGNRVTSIDVRKWSPRGRRSWYRNRRRAITSSTRWPCAIWFMRSTTRRKRLSMPPNKLKYRDFLIVTLVLNCADPFPDNWIYIHSPDVRVGRIQNFRAWSEEMLPDKNTASIGMEYFCNIGDDLWEMNQEELQELAGKELAQLGLAKEDMVIGSAIIRQPKAYPVYDGEYMEALEVIGEWIRSFENFQTVGRNGLHRYNNQDHSMLSAMYAARNILGGSYDVWNVNVERSYHEKMEVENDADARPASARHSAKLQEQAG